MNTQIQIPPHPPAIGAEYSKNKIYSQCVLLLGRSVLLVLGVYQAVCCHVVIQSRKMSRGVLVAPGNGSPDCMAVYEWMF